MEEALYLGLDAGSTTVKLALVDARGTLLEARYERHGAAVRATLRTLLEDLAERRPGLVVRPAMTGSAALRLAQALELPFVQEVLATSPSWHRRPTWPWSWAARTPRSFIFPTVRTICA